MSPWNMKNSVRKIEANGNHQILIADRGTFLGYNMLINDMRCLPIMAETGYPGIGMYRQSRLGHMWH